MRQEFVDKIISIANDYAKESIIANLWSALGLAKEGNIPDDWRSVVQNVRENGPGKTAMTLVFSMNLAAEKLSPGEEQEAIRSFALNTGTQYFNLVQLLDSQNIQDIYHVDAHQLLDELTA